VSNADRAGDSGDATAFHSALLRLSMDVAGYRTLDELCSALATHLKHVVPFDHLGLILIDQHTGAFRIAVIEPSNVGPVPPTTGTIDDLPAGRAWRAQRSVVWRLAGDAPLPGMQPWLRDLGIRVICHVPLTTARERLGLLVFGSTEVDDYSAPMVEMMEQATRQVAVAVEHALNLERLATLSGRLTTERDRVRLMLRVTSAMCSELDLRGLLAVISRELGALIEHHYASITLWDEATHRLRREALVSRSGTRNLEAGALVRQGASLPQFAFDRGETIVFSHHDIETTDQEAARVMIAEGFRSACSMPLKTARGKYGTFNVASPEDCAFPPGEIELLEQIAAQIAMAIENAVHFQQAQRYQRDATERRDRLQMLLDVNNVLIAHADSPEMTRRVAERLRDSVPHDYLSLALYDQESKGLRLASLTQFDDRAIVDPEVSFPVLGSPAGEAFTTGRPVQFRGPDLDRLALEAVPTVRPLGIRAVCCVPLPGRDGPLGALVFGRYDPNGFTDDEIDQLVEVSSQVAIAVENRLAFGRIAALKEKLAEEKLYLEHEITQQHDFTEIIGDSAALRRVLAQIETVAATDATVLLLGETGTGKELLARALHDRSARRGQTFVRFNGAALPASLIESELFGYEKGAFTGAMAAKVGRLELAHRGTLFLDEVGDMPLDIQPKLLRAVQEREFERLGSTRIQRADIRLVAATHRNLEAMVSEGTFRQDLFYRLNVFPILVPPLRERPEDIPALVKHFAAKFGRRLGRPLTTVPAAAILALQRWEWPGNIRELENVIERAVILSKGSVLQVPPSTVKWTRANRTAAGPPAPTFRDGERELILKALRDSKGVIAGAAGAAARLGLKRTTLQSKMRKLGINRPGF
jgi:formate hydrogenlyase transcriptional activator